MLGAHPHGRQLGNAGDTEELDDGDRQQRSRKLDRPERRP